MKNTFLYCIRGILLSGAIINMNDSNEVIKFLGIICIWAFVMTLDKYEK